MTEGSKEAQKSHASQLESYPDAVREACRFNADIIVINVGVDGRRDHRAAELIINKACFIPHHLFDNKPCSAGRRWQLQTEQRQTKENFDTVGRKRCDQRREGTSKWERERAGDWQTLLKSRKGGLRYPWFVRQPLSRSSTGLRADRWRRLTSVPATSSQHLQIELPAGFRASSH